MATESRVFIAGLGYSPSRKRLSGQNVATHLISASTKALLDAGITADDVGQGITDLKASSVVFKAFDSGIPVEEAEPGSEISTSLSWIKDQKANCVLMVTVEKSAAIALVLVSESFLWSRRYLNDSSAFIHEASSLDSSTSTSLRLLDVCHMGKAPLLAIGAYGPLLSCNPVWTLRGWKNARTSDATHGVLHYSDIKGRRFSLGRSDGNPVPKWEDVEHKQDGKHRLGYNPALETMDICQEAFEAVKASGGKDCLLRFGQRGGDRAILARL